MRNKLIVLRAEQKLSQEELALKAGVSRSTISGIEKEKTIPDGETIAKLVKALGVPANQIFFDLDVVCKQHDA